MSQGRRSAEWFAEVAGREVGPISGGALRQLVAEGRVHSETPIRRGSNGPWRPAGEVKGLSPQQAPEPAPEPPPPEPDPEPGDEWDGVPDMPPFLEGRGIKEEDFTDEPPGKAFPPFAEDAGERSAVGRGAKPAYKALRTYSTVLRIVGYVVGVLAVLGILFSLLLGSIAAGRSGEPMAFFAGLASGLVGAIPALLSAFLLIVAAEFVNLAVNVADDLRELKDRTPRR